MRKSCVDGRLWCWACGYEYLKAMLKVGQQGQVDSQLRLGKLWDLECMRPGRDASRGWEVAPPVLA